MNFEEGKNYIQHVSEIIKYDVGLKFYAFNCLPFEMNELVFFQNFGAISQLNQFLLLRSTLKLNNCNLYKINFFCHHLQRGLYFEFSHLNVNNF